MIRVSHVGSFPFEFSIDSIVNVIELYKAAGVDAPSYPQLRDFVEMFLEPFINKDLLANEGGMYIVKDIKELRKAPEVDVHVLEAEKFAELAVGLFNHIRAPVTGAFTLASSILLSPKPEDFFSTALSDRRILESLIEFTRRNLEYFVKLGYNILFVDEPLLSVIVGAKKILMGYNPEDIVHYFNYVFSGIPGLRGIHVCGRISKLLYEILLSIEEINILNFEFYSTRENINILNNNSLSFYGKKLAPGVASSRDLRVESVDEVLLLLEKIVEKTGLNIDLVSADNGFRGLHGAASESKLYEISLGKLKVIKEAVRLLVNRYT